MPADPVDRDALPEDRLHENNTVGRAVVRLTTTRATVLTEWDDQVEREEDARGIFLLPLSARRAGEKLERPCPRPPTGRGGSLKAPVSCASKASTSPSMRSGQRLDRWAAERKGRCSRWKSADAATRCPRAMLLVGEEIERSLVEGREIGPRQGRAGRARSLKAPPFESGRGQNHDAVSGKHLISPVVMEGEEAFLAHRGPRGSRGAPIQTASREAGRSGRAAATALPP